MNNVQTKPFVRLQEEGILLQCSKAFIGKLSQGNNEKQNKTPWKATPTPSWKGSNKYVDFPLIEKGEYLLYLGCQHIRCVSFEKPKKRPLIIDPKFEPNRKVFRLKLQEELFSAAYYTSLKFLWKEKIVKVDWRGKFALDQLFEASSFMYGHLEVPKPLKRKVRE